jgi:hypothetical protein
VINLVNALDRRLAGKSIRSAIHAKLHHSLHRSNDSEEVYILHFIVLKMGFDGLFFARLDYQDNDQRNNTKTMEMIWKGSANLGEC